MADLGYVFMKMGSVFDPFPSTFWDPKPVPFGAPFQAETQGNTMVLAFWDIRNGHNTGSFWDHFPIQFGSLPWICSKLFIFIFIG